MGLQLDGPATEPVDPVDPVDPVTPAPGEQCDTAFNAAAWMRCAGVHPGQGHGGDRAPGEHPGRGRAHAPGQQR